MSSLFCGVDAGVGAGQDFSAAPFSLAMVAMAVALFAGEAYQRHAAGETFDLQTVTAKVTLLDPVTHLTAMLRPW